MRFRDKVRKPKRPVVAYEILPPREKDGTLNSYAEIISSLLSQTHIDAINIPEVHEENARGLRPVKNLERAEAREFGRLLQDNVGIEAIVNRVTVHNDLDYQKSWIKETFYDYDIENLILVGGESSDIKYPGPSVNETSEYITRDLNAGRFDFFCGGITIPSRKIESVRLLKKGSNGIEFFTSQVLYDGKKIKKMLKYYDDVCKENNVLPRRILLSFAPVSSKKNIDFLKWLGVEIPSQTEKRLTNKKTSMSDESLEIASEILKGILNNNEKLGITVPIGLNVEHIMSYNFQSSINMLQELSKIYREFCIKTLLYD
jgi:5,10-methylenetetrahydrofolate reductase